MSKELIYTKHAEMRLNERFISSQDVENAVFNEEWLNAYGAKKKVAHRINGKEIEVILKPEDNKTSRPLEVNKVDGSKL